MSKPFRVVNSLVRIEGCACVMRRPFECVLQSPAVWVLELKVPRLLTVREWSAAVTDALTRRRGAFARVLGEGAMLTLFVETSGFSEPLRLEPTLLAKLASRSCALEHYHRGT